MTGGGNPGGSWSEFAETRPTRLPPAPGDPAATAFLPPVTDDGPTRVPAAGAPQQPALIGRFTVSLAGLLAAGAVVLGVLLVVLMVVVPGTGGTGIDVSTGPGWARAGWHLGVGVAAEVALQVARRRRQPVRITVGLLVIVAVAAVLAFSWWS